jgi:hypothetical protein
MGKNDAYRLRDSAQAASQFQTEALPGAGLMDFVRNAYMPLPLFQEMLNGPRCEGLPARTRDAALL